MEVEQAFEQREQREGALGRLKEKWTVFQKKIWNGQDKKGFAKLQQQVDFDDDEERQNSAQCRPSGQWCPEEKANVWSKMFFTYVESILTLGYRKPLENGDLWDMADRDTASKVSADFQDTLCTGANKGSVGKSMWKQFGTPFVRAGWLKLVHDIIMFTGPLILQELLRCLQGSCSVWYGLLLAFGLALSSVVETVLVNQYFHILFRISLHLKVALTDVLYAKSLKITSGVRSTYGVGAITNLQSNDAAKLYNLPQYLHIIWSGPFQILVTMAMLVRVINWFPALCGLLSTIAFIPVSTWMGRKLASIRKQLMLQTDARIKLCSEVVTGIKAIKLYAWEEPYMERLLNVRGKELEQIKKSLLWGIFNFLIFSGGPIIISLASFTAFAVLGYSLTADVAFVALALFNLLRFPVIMFPSQIMNIINANVALKRIQAFLEAEELTQPDLEPRAEISHPAIKIEDGEFAWSSGQISVLQGINFEALEGQLIMIVGEVGSGKTSLLSAILGELHPISGSVKLQGNVAYTAQEPWIQNATLRDNILMGREYEIERYDRVLEACALKPDLNLLPAGDMSEIGEKGINLSGGQRHRVALARACYAEADVILLDDPLSAVDAHVGQHLWAECICGILSQNTRVLVTHHMHFLPYADYIAVIEKGKIAHFGTFEALDSEVNFHQFELGREDEEQGKGSAIDHKISDTQPGQNLGLDQSERMGRKNGISKVEEQELVPLNSSPQADHNSHLDLQDEINENTQSLPLLHTSNTNGHDFEHDGNQEEVSTPLGISTHMHSILSADLDEMPKGELTGLEHREDIELSPEEAEKHHQVEILIDKPDNSKIIKAEERAIGSVQRSIYMTYLRSWGPLWFSSLILVAGLSERGVAIIQNFWLKVWSDATTKSSNGKVDVPFYLSIYFAFGLGSLAVMAVRSACMVRGMVNAARKLHQSLLEKVIRMPMSFFDSQPTGRLLNRFSRDTEALDTSLGNTVSSFITCIAGVLGALCVVVGVTPSLIFAIVPLFFFYRQVQMYFIATSRELKRLDSLAMSPIFGLFSESLAGLITLRAFRKQSTFLARNQDMLDRSNRVYWLIQSVNRWLSVRLEIMGIFIILGTAIIVTIFPTNAGLAGLALTAALNLTGTMNWMVRMTADLEVSMNSVERVVEYEPLETEAPAIVPNNRPPQNWPSEGKISLQNMVVRYRPELPAVIDRLSFSTNAKEKIGVAGRTGCGKSTLMMALYRIVEPCGGSVIIDGINVAKIGLTDLRSRLALVPQDPVIFSGTIRTNLDPFNTAGSDDNIWASLRQAGLETTVQSMSDGLESNLSEGGGNLSTGQRQLLCMARALLKKARILILDEATSNVDPATDALIQTTIRTAFKECTTMTVAHRLHTIMDSDRVLILDAGKLLEFDSPQNLLKDKSSAFSKLVADSRKQGGRSKTSSIADLVQLDSKR